MTDLATTPVTKQLLGTCNRCGLCCTTEQDGKVFLCVHLRKFAWSRLGAPEATFCAVHATRTPFMTITMKATDGSTVIAFCAPSGSPEEGAAIVERGFGRGCSLRIEGEAP
jgi:hypothetical protein